LSKWATRSTKFLTALATEVILVDAENNSRNYTNQSPMVGFIRRQTSSHSKINKTNLES